MRLTPTVIGSLPDLGRDYKVHDARLNGVGFGFGVAAVHGTSTGFGPRAASSAR